MNIYCNYLNLNDIAANENALIKSCFFPKMTINLVSLLLIIIIAVLCCTDVFTDFLSFIRSVYDYCCFWRFM